MTLWYDIVTLYVVAFVRNILSALNLLTDSVTLSVHFISVNITCDNVDDV